MNRLSDILKVDTALTPVSLNGASTGFYFPMKDYRKALFIVNLGAMAAAVTSALQIMQAKDKSGTGAKVITNNTCTITANTKVAAATLTAAACAVADTFSLQGITFTGAAEADHLNHIFATDATENDGTATAIAAAINAAVAAGDLKNLSASASGAVVTIIADETGEMDITVVGTAVRLVAATLRAVGFIETDVGFLDNNSDFTHVGIRVTNSAATLTSAILIRGNGRISPEQFVAASKVTVAA
ncbi:MAG: hypothetical protein JW915_23615 [Chitinispirillaceae bacterium]|nr:hypothetical protein [Chitinispirillaceae bacterium]